MSDDANFEESILEIWERCFSNTNTPNQMPLNSSEITRVYGPIVFNESLIIRSHSAALLPIIIIIIMVIIINSKMMINFVDT